MKYLHTMIRVHDLDAALRFFCDGLGLREASRMENEAGRFTLIFLAAPGDEDAQGFRLNRHAAHSFPALRSL